MSSFYGCCGSRDGGGPGTPGVGIKKAELNEQGELIFTYTNNVVQNVGPVVGTDGKNGVTFIPHTDNNILSWTNDGSLPNPDPIDFTGQDPIIWTELQEKLKEELGWGDVDDKTDPVESSDYEWGFLPEVEKVKTEWGDINENTVPVSTNDYEWGFF